MKMNIVRYMIYSLILPILIGCTGNNATYDNSYIDNSIQKNSSFILYTDKIDGISFMDNGFMINNREYIVRGLSYDKDYIKSDNTNLKYKDRCYRYDCMPSAIRRLWDEYDSYWDNKQYEAIYLGDWGTVDVYYKPFGTKLIEGMNFEYQYGLLLKTRKIDKKITMRGMLLLVEPLDSLQIKVVGYYFGVSYDSYWLNGKDNLTPLVIFEQEYNQSYPCKHGDWEYIDSFFDPENKGITIDPNILIMKEAKFYLEKYDDINDTIKGNLKIQFNYVKDDSIVPFIQRWDLLMEVID